MSENEIKPQVVSESDVTLVGPGQEVGLRQVQPVAQPAFVVARPPEGPGRSR